MDELKPCPFCGGEARRNEIGRVSCFNSHCPVTVDLTPEDEFHSIPASMWNEAYYASMWNEAYCWKEISSLKSKVEELEKELRRERERKF